MMNITASLKSVGAGGDEGNAGDLFRMYSRYVENNWRVELMSTSDGEHGGF